MPPRTSPAAASAGSILVTVLGEYVLPTSAGVWQETLVRAMGVMGHSAATVRQAISRAVRDGALVTTRHGNRAYVELRDEARETLQKGADRLADDFDQPWDGEWDVFVVRLAGKDSTARYHLRTSLLLKGLGYLGNGVWISPPTTLRDEIAQALEAEAGTSVLVMRSRIEHPSLSEVVRRGWDLDATAARYEDLLARFSDPRVEDARAAFLAWTGLMQAWRDCALADPGLPAAALPPDWPRTRTGELVAARRQQWRPPAHQFFTDL